MFVTALMVLRLPRRLFLVAAPANAFDNAIPDASKFADRPKRAGPPPRDRGLRDRGLDDDDLKLCGGAPNCFCTTPDDVAPEHYIAPWRPPSTLTKAQAWQSVRDAVARYQPGQANIDGGGFRIVQDTDAYLYAQFESLKNGYVDDVEFAFTGDELKVRPSSRVGYLDLGVNAKRLNAIAASLRNSKWDAPDITPNSHPSYFAQNAPKSVQVAPSTAFRR